MNGKEIFSPDPERPLMMMRLRSGHEKPEVWNRLFPQLCRTKACCDEVWFSTGVGVPTLEKHRQRSEYMALCARELRETGIIPSLQLQSTLGHSDDIIASAGASGKTWSSYVGVNGEQCRYVSCPRQKGFLEYFREVAKIYAQWHPGSVWIDDDLRLHNHKPAMQPCGCYCPDCLEIFGREEGVLYTREELVSAYREDPALYKRWENFGIRSLSQVAEVVVKAFLEISPETRFGLQHCLHLMRLPVIEALKKHSRSRVGSRPGGGAYCDFNPAGILDKGILLSMEIRDQQKYDTLSQICPEIESCPRTMTCKTSRGHRLESLYYLAMGHDSLSYFIMDPALETPEWYGRELLEPLAAESPCYKAYIRHNENTFASGIGVAARVGAVPGIEQAGLAVGGTAFGGCADSCSAFILWGTAAEKLSEEELEKIFAKGCILDGYAAAALQERGLNHLMGGIRVNEIQIASSEYYTSDPLNHGFETRYHSPLNKRRFAFEIPEGLKVRIPGVYRDNEESFQGNATVLFESASGSRCALLGYEGLCIHYISSDRVRQLNRIADWVSKETLPVLPEEPAQCIIVPRVTEKNLLRSVLFLNPTIGSQKEKVFLLRGVPESVTAGEFCIPGEAPVKVGFLHENGFCKISLPALSAWNTGWLKIPF